MVAALSSRAVVPVEDAGWAARLSVTGPEPVHFSTIHNGTDTHQGTTGHDAGKLQTIGSGLTFAYDAQGNRTCQGTGAPCSSNTTYTYGYDGNNRLTSWADTGSDSETFAYDGNGLLQQTIYKTPGSVCPSIPQGPSATPWTPVLAITKSTQRWSPKVHRWPQPIIGL